MSNGRTVMYVRMPPHLHHAIKVLATQEHRSVNAQAVALLEQAVKRNDKAA